MPLSADKYFTKKDTVVVTDGAITIEEYCEEHCEEVWSRMNVVLVETVPDPK